MTNKFVVTLAIIFIVLVIFLLIASYWTVSYPNWKPDPKNALDTVTSQLGPPSSINPEAGGQALWSTLTLKHRGEPITSSSQNDSGSVWNEVILKDEEIKHCCPTTHNDFLYCSLCIDISDPVVLTAVLSISESMYYDSLKSLLWVRCGSLQSNVASALLATRFVLLIPDGTTQLDSVADLYDYYWNNTDEIQSNYATLIAGAQIKDSYADYMNELVANVAKIGCSAGSNKNCDDATKCTTIFDADNVNTVLTADNITIPQSSSSSSSDTSSDCGDQEYGDKSTGVNVFSSSYSNLGSDLTSQGSAGGTFELNEGYVHPYELATGISLNQDKTLGQYDVAPMYSQQPDVQSTANFVSVGSNVKCSNGSCAVNQAQMINDYTHNFAPSTSQYPSFEQTNNYSLGPPENMYSNSPASNISQIRENYQGKRVHFQEQTQQNSWPAGLPADEFNPLASNCRAKSKASVDIAFV
ncbi:MAG: hypothetical protein JKX76_01490 [Colwellia sp.]|nr:hypothetical protein [Colwellia sp.]